MVLRAIVPMAEQRTSNARESRFESEVAYEADALRGGFERVWQMPCFISATYFRIFQWQETAL